MHLMRRAALLGLSAGLLLLLAQPMPGAAGGAAKRPTPAELAQLNVTSLTVASYDIEQQALASGAIAQADRTLVTGPGCCWRRSTR